MVTNGGPSTATNVTVVDDLPIEVTFQSATTSQGSLTDVGQIITAQVGTLLPGETATITIDALVDAAFEGTISNTAVVMTDGTETDLTNNEATEETTIVKNVDLAITKSDSINPAIPGQQLVYQLVVTNDGPSNSTGVEITDVLPSEVSFVSGSSTQGTVSNSGNDVTVTVGDLDVGDSVTVDLVVLVESDVSNSFSNTATVTANENELDLTNNTDTEPTDVLTQFDLRIVKADSPDPVVPGQQLTYTLTVFNLSLIHI